MHRIQLASLITLLLVPRGGWAQGGDPLGPEFRVNTYTTNSQRYPAIGADTSGSFVVVWESTGQDGAAGGIFGQRYSAAGGPLGPEFRVNTFTATSQNAPAVAVDGSGNFMVVWHSAFQTGSGSDIFGQRYDSSGLPLGSEFLVNTYTTSDQSAPSLSANATGDYLVVWSSLQGGASFDIFGQRYSGSGATLGPEFRINTHTTMNQSVPSIATDVSGNFVVVWKSDGQDGSNYGVFGQRYAGSGSPLGIEFRVNTFTTATQADPSVATDSSGNFVVVWHSSTQDGSGFGIFGQRYASTGAPIGPEFRVNDFTLDFQGDPSVAADSAGNFVVVWQSFAQLHLDLFGQRYASTGAPVGLQFGINTFTTDMQAQASVVAIPSGNFVVTWQSPQDGSGYGIYGQRYGRIVPVELMQFRVE